MKRFHRMLSAALCCLLLLAAVGVNAKAETKASGVLPLISITTEDQGAGRMDFATLPVDANVSAQVASWTPDYVMPPEPWYERCTITLTDGGETLLDGAEADVKVRGNWTTNYTKKPLRIKFQEKQSMLGMNGGAKMKSWVLLAEYKDLSMLRNRTGMALAREILGPDGFYSADTRLVEVEINGEYWGVYLLTEQQQVNKNRIAVTEPEKGYTGTDIGYFLEFDGYYVDEEPLQRFHVSYADNAPLVPYDGNGGSGRTMRCLPQKGMWDFKKDVGFTIKSDIYCQEQNDFIAGFMENVYRILYAAAYEQKAMVFDEDYSAISEDPEITPREAVERVLDVQSLVDMYILSELTCDADIYWSSFFMDVDFGEKGDRRLRFEAPWDFDSSLGNKNRCIDGTGFYAANIVPDVNGGTDYGGMYETINPWLAVLANEDWFREMVCQKWTEVYDGGAFDRVLSGIDSEKTELKKAFLLNYVRWSNLKDKSEFEGELSGPARSCKTHAQAADQLADWLSSRIGFLNDNWHL